MSKNITSYIIEEFSLNRTYSYYGRSVNEYTLTLDTGEKVLFNRSVDAPWQPYQGQEISGEIVEGKHGAMLKLQALPVKKTDSDEPKMNITGTQLFIAYLEWKKLYTDTTQEEFIDMFRQFQKLL